MATGRRRRNFAAHVGKIELYKFRPYGHAVPETRAHQVDRVRQIVENHKIYFARASQLNDPFDMSPRVEFGTREELLSAAAAYFEKRPDLEEHERQSRLEHLKTCDLAEQCAFAQSTVRHRIENGYWVFSLAGNRSHPMLWSHYAGGHTGLCIHFRSDANSLFGGSQAVVYEDLRPSIPINVSSMPKEKVWERILLTKGRFWDYEEEFRWFRFPDEDWTGLPIRFDGQFAEVPPTCLSGITVGARMPDADVVEVLNLAKQHQPALPVWRAVEQETFDFEFERIG